jgi:hypothetical protein
MDYHGEVALPSLSEVTVSECLRSTDYTQLCGSVRGTSPSPDRFCLAPPTPKKNVVIYRRLTFTFARIEIGYHFRD